MQSKCNQIVHCCRALSFEPRREKTCIYHIYANNTSTDKSVHRCKLVSDVVVRCPDFIVFKDSSFLLITVAAPSSVSPNFNILGNPEYLFSQDYAH